VLAVLTSGFFMLMLDTSIVNVAVPTMLRDLRTNLNGIGPGSRCPESGCKT
jgi:hypothetical protein